jgi:hypothetical protein
MNENKTAQIKQIVAKIDTDNIVSYLQEHSSSKTLKQIIRYSKKISENNDEKMVFKLGVKIAYNLDTICDLDKAGYVKDEKEKKHWLEISEELFKHTIGKKK